MQTFWNQILYHLRTIIKPCRGHASLVSVDAIAAYVLAFMTMESLGIECNL